MIKLELTDEEFQAVLGLMDTGVRAKGLEAIKCPATVLEKFAAAQEKAAKRKPKKDTT